MSSRHPSELPLEDAELRPRYSIVVPAYNEAALLPATLASLQAQTTTVPFEIVVVDNRSTDATASIARSYGVCVVDEAEAGVCQARQRGLAAAAGEFVISTDADTLYPPTWLARIEQLRAEHPDAVAIAGPCRYADPPWWMAAFCRALFGAVGAVYVATGRVGYVTATNLAFRRSALPDGYDLTLTQGGDELDVLRRLRRRGRVVWDAGNVVTASARRQRQGLLHTVVVTFLWYYLLGYGLNRVLRRKVLGMAPAVRARPARHRRSTASFSAQQAVPAPAPDVPAPEVVASEVAAPDVAVEVPPPTRSARRPVTQSTASGPGNGP